MYDTYLTIIIQAGPIPQMELLVPRKRRMCFQIKGNEKGNLSHRALCINLGIHLFFATVKIMIKKVGDISTKRQKEN
jgi:hypothetical protein